MITPLTMPLAFSSVPQAPGFAGHGTQTDLGQNWRVAFRDSDGTPLNMQSFELVDFGAISYKEIFQNVKTIVATPMFSAALERLLGVDARIVDLPIDAAAEATVALMQAIYFWEPRAQAVEINFEADVLNGHLIVLLQLQIKNVTYETEIPYDKNTILPPLEEDMSKGPKGDKGDKGDVGMRGSIWFTGTEDPPEVPPSLPPPIGAPKANDLYLNTTTGDVFVYVPVASTTTGGTATFTWKKVGAK